VTRARVERALVAGVAVALGAAAVDAARRAPEFALAGDSLPRLILGVAAGCALVAAGLALTARESRTSGRLLAAAGCAWLAAGLGTPGARWGVAFTLGLVVAAAAPALVGHALLVTSGDALRNQLDRAAAVTLYASLFGLLGLLPTLVFDQEATGCASCPPNLLGVADEPAAVADLSRWGIRLGLVATGCALALALWRIARAPAARRRHAAPLVLPGCAYLALVAADLGHASSRGILGSDGVDQALWAAQAAALLGVAGGVALLHAAARRRRARLARLVVDLTDTRRPGGLRDALASMLGDPWLDLLYARDGGDGWIDAGGRARTPQPGLDTTRLVREGEPLALLCHQPGLLDDPRQAAEIERSVRLGLEHERLQAELGRQLEHLRRSRADVAAAGEAERRLLERDLHDGAQQRLVAFAFELGIARRRAGSERAAALERAQREVQEALAELRELAHGLYPVALADAGLAAALESLSDRRPELRADRVVEGRFPPAVEEAAYLAIASLADEWAPQPLGLSAVRDDDQLVIDLRTPAPPPADVVHIEDRVGALGGSIAVTRAAGAETRVTVELPCA
jgi:signal transduction histidine kinase